MSEHSTAAKVAASAVGGALVGFLVAGCLGGPVAFVWERKLAHQKRAGWNLVPVVVAAVDIPAGALVTMEMVSQRSIPEQFVTASVVKPDSASYIIGAPVTVRMEAGDMMMWSFFEHAVPSRECAVLAEQLVRQWKAPPSSGLGQLVGALKQKARTGAATER